jgi:hypothetical protein
MKLDTLSVRDLQKGSGVYRVVGIVGAGMTTLAAKKETEKAYGLSR